MYNKASPFTIRCAGFLFNKRMINMNINELRVKRLNSPRKSADTTFLLENIMERTIAVRLFSFRVN